MQTGQSAASDRHAASPGLQQPLPATAVITLQSWERLKVQAHMTDNSNNDKNNNNNNNNNNNSNNNDNSNSKNDDNDNNNNDNNIQFACQLMVSMVRAGQALSSLFCTLYKVYQFDSCDT